MTVAFTAMPAADRVAARRALGIDTEIFTRVQILTLNHTLVQTIEVGGLIDAQVNVNNTDGPNKVLSAGFRDPGHSLRFDTGSPAQGLNGPDRLLRLTQMWYVPDLDDWCAHDVVTGRPTTIQRDGETLVTESQDKACLHLRNVPSYTLNKGANVVNAIRLILSKSGETHFKFPANIKKRLPRDVHVGGADAERQPWLVARKLARSIGMQLYYDGSGYACLRVPPASAAWRIVEPGVDDGQISPNALAPIKSSVDLATLRNKVVVKYHTPKTKKKKAQTLSVVVAAAASHPFSAQSLAVNGVPWVSVEYYDEQDIHTEADARKFGQARLNEFLTQAVQIQCDIIPVWHLNPLDLITVEARGATYNIRFTEGSIPCGPSDSAMTVGYQAYVRKPTAGIIRKK